MKQKKRQLIKTYPENFHSKAMKLPKFPTVSLGFHYAFSFNLTGISFKRAFFKKQ